MTAGEGVALKPALAEVFGEDLRDPPVRGEVLVGLQGLGLPGLAGDVEERAEPVGGSLVRTHDPEVTALGGLRHDVGDETAEYPRGFVQGGSRFFDGDGEMLKGREGKRASEQAAVGVLGGAKTSSAIGDAGEHLGGGAAVLVEEFLRPVGAQPRLQLGQVVGVFAYAGERHLVGAPGSLDRHAVHGRGARPALGRAQHDHRPAGAALRVAVPGGLLDGGDAFQGLVHGLGHRLVDLARVVAGDVQRFVAVSLEEGVKFGLGDTGEHRRIGDLVAVEVEDGQDRTVVDRVEELVGVPGGGERSRLGLAVTDDAGDEEARVVEGGSVGVREGVAEFTALVDRAGRLRGHMARHAAGEGELPEQLRHA